MFKFMKTFLVIAALLGFATASQATDGVINATVILKTPITGVEVTGWTMVLNRKTGYTFPPAASYSQGANWLTYYDKDPYTAQAAGCYKSGGEASSPFSLSYAPPTTLDCGAGVVINLTTAGPQDKFVGAIDDTSCANAIAGTYAITNINGTVPMTLSATGEKFIAWKMGNQVNVKINSALQSTCTGTGVFTHNYL